MLLVHWVVAHVFSLHEHVNLAECRPLYLVPVPAFQHEIEDLLGAVRRWGEVDLLVVVPVEVATVLDHLFVCHGAEWLLPRKRQDLPYGDCIRPDVTLAGEFTLEINHCYSS